MKTVYDTQYKNEAMNSGYYKTKASVDEYIALAKGVDGSNLISQLTTYLPPESLLLEIGSGPGTDFEILKKKYKVVGSDFSDEFLSRLLTNHPANQFLNLDAITLETKMKFDGIYSNKVLHHLTDDELQQSILRQQDILNPGGVICHSFWKGMGEEVFKGLFVNYQNHKSLSTYFEAFFEILLLEEYNEFESGDSLLLIGKKK